MCDSVFVVFQPKRVGNHVQPDRVDKRPGSEAFGRTSSGRKYQFRPLIAGNGI